MLHMTNMAEDHLRSQRKVQLKNITNLKNWLLEDILLEEVSFKE